MWILNLVKLAVKQILRHPIRSMLTVIGIATGMFLFVCIETMQSGMRTAAVDGEDATSLVVFRKDRFCPYSSQMPEHYVKRIEQIDGV